MEDITLFAVLSLLYYPTVFSFASSIVFNFSREKREFSKNLRRFNKILLISGFVYIFTMSFAIIMHPGIGIITLAAGIVSTVLFLPYYILLLSYIYKTGRWKLFFNFIFSILLGVTIISVIFGIIDMFFGISFEDFVTAKNIFTGECKLFDSPHDVPLWYRIDSTCQISR